MSGLANMIDLTGAVGQGANIGLQQRAMDHREAQDAADREERALQREIAQHQFEVQTGQHQQSLDLARDQFGLQQAQADRQNAQLDATGVLADTLIKQSQGQRTDWRDDNRGMFYQPQVGGFPNQAGTGTIPPLLRAYPAAQAQQQPMSGFGMPGGQPMNAPNPLAGVPAGLAGKLPPHMQSALVQSAMQTIMAQQEEERARAGIERDHQKWVMRLKGMPGVLGEWADDPDNPVKIDAVMKQLGPQQAQQFGATQQARQSGLMMGYQKAVEQALGHMMTPYQSAMVGINQQRADTQRDGLAVRLKLGTATLEQRDRHDKAMERYRSAMSAFREQGRDSQRAKDLIESAKGIAEAHGFVMYGDWVNPGAESPDYPMYLEDRARFQAANEELARLSGGAIGDRPGTAQPKGQQAPPTDKPKPGATGDNLPSPKTENEFAALPVGTVYIDPEGRKRIKGQR
jgi:hypothetical protein